MNKRLKELRKALRLTQAELAQRLGTTTAAIGNWETRESLPDARVRLICAEFGVSKEWLISGKGEMFVEAKESNEEARELSFARRIISAMTDHERELFARALQEETQKYLSEQRTQTNNGTINGDMIQNN